MWELNTKNQIGVLDFSCALFDFNMHNKCLLIFSTQLPSFLYSWFFAADCTNHCHSTFSQLSTSFEDAEWYSILPESCSWSPSTWVLPCFRHLLHSVSEFTSCFQHHVIPSECPSSGCSVRQEISKVTHKAFQPPTVRNEESSFSSSSNKTGTFLAFSYKIFK